jgi:hypothetical protein
VHGHRFARHKGQHNARALVEVKTVVVCTRGAALRPALAAHHLSDPNHD